MNYQDLGGPTSQNYFPTGDSAKLDTSLTDAQKRKVDMVCRVMRKHRKEKQVKDIQEVTKKIMTIGGFMYEEADRPRRSKRKGKKAKAPKGDQNVDVNDINAPSDPKPNDSSNLI